MCGIVGILGSKNVVPHLFSGMQRLEYRGYDSSGIAILKEGNLLRKRQVGKLVNLQETIKDSDFKSEIGIGHIRWATHGGPSLVNAHPHMNDTVAVVHNGIIENHQEMRLSLQKKGYQFESETDTEVVVHLMTDFLKHGMIPLQALQELNKTLKGAYAIVMIIKNFPSHLLFIRRGSPMVLGTHPERLVISSDALGVGDLANQLIYLEDGDYGIANKDEIIILNADNNVVNRPSVPSSFQHNNIDKGSYRHFMLKEIFEQPNTSRGTLFSLMSDDQKIHEDLLGKIKIDKIKRILFIACGTSFYAAMIAKYWIENYAKLSCHVDIASEFRYRSPVIEEGTLAVFISQSGETIDTLASIQLIKSELNKASVQTLALVNVAKSSIDRECDHSILTNAGPEIGVAATKSFTSQLIVLASLTLLLGVKKKSLSQDGYIQLCHELHNLPVYILQALQTEIQIQDLSNQLSQCHNAIYVGRGTSYPLALEGALKLKEISYIHAEGFASGELKHGPIALIDQSVKTIAIAPFDPWFEKTASNLHEIMARSGHIICLTDTKGDEHIGTHTLLQKVIMPEIHDFIKPIVYSIPIQLLAYYTALAKGTDVDQPRNLAKSVTVE